MTPTIRIVGLIAVSAFTAVAAGPMQRISTIGPVELCESQALTQTLFNPSAFPVAVEAGLIQDFGGRLEWDSMVFQVLPGRGASVVYQQGRVLLDADWNESLNTCEKPVAITVVVKAKGEVSSSAVVRGFDKSHRLNRLHRVGFDSRGVSEPFQIAAGEVTVRLLNVGPLAGAYTIEIADAITGLIVAAKTVYLEPGLDSQQAGLGASAEFTFWNEQAGARVDSIKLVSPDVLPLESAAEAALAISIEMDVGKGGNDISLETVTIVHEGFEIQ